MKPLPLILATILGLASPALAENSQMVYSARFRDTALGQIPAGWQDLINYRPTRNWAVDGNGLLRVMMKEYVGDATEGEPEDSEGLSRGLRLHFSNGLLIYEGLLGNGARADALGNVTISARIQKTPDPNVAAGLVLHLKDVNNYYAARLKGSNQLEIVKVVSGQPQSLATFVTRSRISEQDTWTFSFQADGNVLTARLQDASGTEQARLDAQDDTSKRVLWA